VSFTVHPGSVIDLEHMNVDHPEVGLNRYRRYQSQSLLVLAPKAEAFHLSSRTRKKSRLL